MGGKEPTTLMQKNIDSELNSKISMEKKLPLQFANYNT